MPYTVQQAAAELHMKPKDLFRWLRQNRVIDAGNLPYQQFKDSGWLTVQISHWRHPVTEQEREYKRPMITEKGLAWLRNRIKEQTSCAP